MTTTATHESVFAPVLGGDLHALTWGDAARTIVGIHGITASAISLQPIADRLAHDARLVAPDLRGRGRSAHLPGPYGMAAHANDIAALLDHLSVERAELIGESMGGYVAVQFALLHPDRVSRIVLVDGGLPLPIPQGMDPDVLVESLLGPALERLRLTFRSREEYFDFWRAHPAFASMWSPYLEAYLDDDLVGTAPWLHSAVSEGAVRADSRDQLVNPFLDHFGEIACPVTLLRAERNLMDQAPGVFPDAVVAAAQAQLPALTERLIPDTNHYSLMLTGSGADEIVAAVQAA